jgi:hypothetical protein
MTPDGPLNILNTHLQAWNTAEAIRVRKGQIYELLKFKNENIDRGENQVICGDFNFDLYTQKDHITWIEKILKSHVVPLDNESGKFSSDPHTNQLVGNDCSSYYKTEHYPNGCYDIYEDTLSCPCCPQELLDLFFINDAEVLSCQVLTEFRTSKNFLAKLNFTTERYLTDLSDHYPVLVNLKFQNFPNISSPQPDNQSYSGTILLLLVVIVLAVSYGFHR